MNTQKRFQHLTALAILACGSFAAAASPLLGTKTPFSSTKFCKTYGCQLTTKQTLATGWTEYRYTLAPERPTPDNDIPTPGPTLSVIRAGEVMKSISFETGAQDDVFWKGQFLTRVWTEAITLVTGIPFSENQLNTFEMACGKARGKEYLQKTGGFTLSCVISGGEYGNAVRASFRVYQ